MLDLILWYNLIIKKGLNVSFFPGTAQTASVKRDAEIGVAQANRDAGIREAECEKTAMDVKYNTGMTTSIF